MKRIILTCVAVALLSLPTIAQITPAEAIEQMGRGINLGNTFEAPDEGEWGNNFAKELYFDMYKEAGFSTVRIPVRWDEHTMTSSPYTVDQVWMDRIEEVVDWGLERDLIIIINAHHEDWFKESYAQQTTRDRMDSIWSQVAVHFKDKPEKLFFEMMNEPQGLEQDEIDDFNQRTMALLRKTNPTRMIIYGGKGWSSSGDMMDAIVPDDPYIIAYYHAYNPWSFAGESQGTWGSESDIQNKLNSFANVRQWADEQGVEVLLGEFGNMYDCDYNSAMKHYATDVEGCITNKIAWTVWDDDGWFQVLMRDDEKWNEIKDVLIHTYPEGPNKLKLSTVEDTLVEVSWELRSDDHDSLFLYKGLSKTDLQLYRRLAPDASSYKDTTTHPEGRYFYKVAVSYIDSIEMHSYPQSIYIIPTERTPFHGSAMSVPGTIEAEDYDMGGEMLTYHETVWENQGGAYRLDEPVDIEARTSGGYQLAYVEPGEWVEYTIDVASAGRYKITVPIASMDGGGIFRLTIPGSSIISFTAPKTSSWQTTADVIEYAELSAGEKIMRVSIISEPSFNIDKFIFEDVTGREEYPGIVSLQVYPNPASHVVYIVSGADLGRLDVRLLSLCGQEVRNYVLDDPSLNSLSVDDLDPGMYILQFRGEGVNETRRLIISGEDG